MKKKKPKKKQKKAEGGAAAAMNESGHRDSAETGSPDGSGGQQQRQRRGSSDSEEDSEEHAMLAKLANMRGMQAKPKKSDSAPPPKPPPKESPQAAQPAVSRCNICGESGHQRGECTDPRAPNAVKNRLEELYASGVPRKDVDERCRDFLGKMDPYHALSALSEYKDAATGPGSHRIKNKSAYLMGVLKKYDAGNGDFFAGTCNTCGGWGHQSRQCPQHYNGYAPVEAEAAVSSTNEHAAATANTCLPCDVPANTVMIDPAWTCHACGEYGHLVVDCEQPIDATFKSDRRRIEWKIDELVADGVPAGQIGSKAREYLEKMTNVPAAVAALNMYWYNPTGEQELLTLLKKFNGNKCTECLQFGHQRGTGCPFKHPCSRCGELGHKANKCPGTQTYTQTSEPYDSTPQQHAPSQPDEWGEWGHQDHEYYDYAQAGEYADYPQHGEQQGSDGALVEEAAAELAVLDVNDAPADKPGTGKTAKRRNKNRPDSAADVEVIVGPIF